MSQFTISPGVAIHEIDQSQYTATSDTTGNVVALIGYAERGSFDPTLVYGVQDFNDTYGFTLKDIPYLAQAAYKYFNNGNVLLVVRAGDSRDPDVYPNAAKYSSKTIRISPKEQVAVPGYQTFKTTTDLKAGSFTSSLSYGFKLLADSRAFSETKNVEAWSNGLFDETYNELGSSSPTGTMLDAVLKVAESATTDSSFNANFKMDYSDGSTVEYYGTGTRSGLALGSTFKATLYQYRKNDIYADDSAEWITFNGAYEAVAFGTANLITGYDWENTAQSFNIVLGATTYKIDLAVKTTSITEVVSALQAAIKKATNTTTNAETDISDVFTVAKFAPTATTAYVALIHKGGSATGFDLIQGDTDALTTLGIAPSTYNDASCLFGKWNAQRNGKAFSGNFAIKKTSTDTASVSFQDPVQIDLVAPADGNWTLDSIKSAIQAKVNAAYSAYNYPAARATVSLDSGKIKIGTIGASKNFASIVKISTGSGNDIISLLGGTDSAVVGKAPTNVGEADITLTATEKGSWGQKLYLKTETQIVKLGSTSNTYYNVYVYLDGKVVSSYYKINWTDNTSSSYILTKMASDAYIAMTTDDEDGDSVLAMLPDGEWTLGDGDLPDGITSTQAEIVSHVVGTNGWVEDTNGAITSMTSDFTDALEKISNPEVYEMHIVAGPGDASSGWQTNLQDFVNARRDCIGVVDAAPFGLGLGIASKTNSISEVNDACSSLNSSYMSAFWPWILDTDDDNSQYVWLPPSIYAINAMVYTDSVADPWYAPAGLTRGVVSATDIEYSPKDTDRDVLYGGTAIVNPIVKFVNEGIAIWGQKTAQRTTTALNRINVRRLMIYAEKLIAKMARSFLFEPNDSTNWAAFARQANAILEPIRQRRGLYSFSVTCDSSTNTDSIVDQNYMVGKIYLKPEKTIEGISVDFTVQATGTVTYTEAST